MRGQELHLGHSAGSGGHHHGLRGTTMAAPGGVPASSSWTTPIAGPDWRREKATRQGRVRVWKWEGGRLVMLEEKGRDGAAAAAGGNCAVLCCAGLGRALLCFAACEGYDVMLMAPHRYGIGMDGWSNKVDCQQEKGGES